MSEVNMKKVVGEMFEDMSISEMTLVQGSGDVNGEVLTSPVCAVSVKVSVAATKSSKACAAAASGIISGVSGAVVSAVKC